MARTTKPKKISVYDEGVVLVDDVDSIDFTGSGHTGSAFGNDVTEDFSGGGGQTPWTSDIKANGFNLFDLGDIEFKATGELKGFYTKYTLGGTVFTGSGRDNFLFSGSYTGSSTPTYSFTVTALKSQTVDMDDVSGFIILDTCTGDNGDTGTIIDIIPGTNTLVITPDPGSDFQSDSTITDDGTAFAANILQANGISDLGTLTDGTTTIDYQTMHFPVTLSGVAWTLSGTNPRYWGHTLGDSWSSVVTSSTTLDDMVYLDASTGNFVLGDKNDEVYGNRFETDIKSGHTRFFIKDKDNVYFKIDNFTNKITFPTISGGSGEYIAINSSGDISPGSPLSIGTLIGGANQNGVLYADTSAKLGENAGNFYYNTSTLQFNVGWGGNPYLFLDAANYQYWLGDYNNAHNGTKIRLDDFGKNVEFLTATDGSLFLADTSGNVGFLVQFNSGNPNITFGVNGLGNSTTIKMDDTAGTVTLNNLNGTIISQLGGAGSGAVGVDTMGLLSFIAGINATITTAKLTTLGSNGSMTFTNGILTAQSPAT